MLVAQLAWLLSAITHTESLDMVSYRFDQRHRLRYGRLEASSPILLTALQYFWFWRDLVGGGSDSRPGNITRPQLGCVSLDTLLELSRCLLGM